MPHPFAFTPSNQQLPHSYHITALSKEDTLPQIYLELPPGYLRESDVRSGADCSQGALPRLHMLFLLSQPPDIVTGL